MQGLIEDDRFKSMNRYNDLEVSLLRWYVHFDKIFSIWVYHAPTLTSVPSTLITVLLTGQRVRPGYKNDVQTAVGLSDLKSTKTWIPPGYWRLILLPMQAWLGIWCREDAPSIWYNTRNLYQCYIRSRKNSWIWRYGCPDGSNEQNNYDGLWTRRPRTRAIIKKVPTTVSTTMNA